MTPIAHRYSFSHSNHNCHTTAIHELMSQRKSGEAAQIENLVSRRQEICVVDLNFARLKENIRRNALIKLYIGNTQTCPAHVALNSEAYFSSLWYSCLQFFPQNLAQFVWRPLLCGKQPNTQLAQCVSTSILYSRGLSCILLLNFILPHSNCY